MSDTNVDKCILIPPEFCPVGPFWGVIKQSGHMVASQIVEREDAEILRVVKNMMAGDRGTIVKVAENLRFILGREVSDIFPGEDQRLVNALSEAIFGVAQEIKNKDNA